MMRRSMLMFILICLVCPSALAADAVRDSVVKIYSTQRMPDFVRPWTKANPRQISGSGAILDGQRILTNAHVVLYASRILVQANQSTERVPATVEAIAPGADLAILKVRDASLFDGRSPLELATGLPNIKDTVNAYGYPIGGQQMSVTEGIISRVEYASYRYGVSGLRIQVDAALNPGNSGGPAIAGGQIVGLVFSTIPTADNIGYLIPADEIRMFLTDIKDGHYDGKPHLKDDLQTVENRALRAKLHLKPETGGLMVTRVRSDDNSYPLKEWDVITHIGKQALDKQGKVQVGEELRLSFRYLIPKLAQGDKLPATVLRDGKSMQTSIPLERGSQLLVDYLRGAYPPYFICGPMVFTIGTQDLLSGLRGTGQLLLGSRQNPLISRRFERKKEPGDQLVMLGAQLFSHPLAEGYDAQSFGVVASVNDLTIKNLAHLVETIRKATGQFITIKIDGAYETLVFDRQELIDSTEQILEDEGIRNQMPQELLKIWEGH